MTRPLDAVFEGGGAKGLAHIGALLPLEDAGFAPRRLVGTSAGAMCAALWAAGYTGRTMRQVALQQNDKGESRMTDFMRAPGPFTNQQRRESVLGELLNEVDSPLIPDFIEQAARDQFMRSLAHIEGFDYLFSFVEYGGVFAATGFLRWFSEAMDAICPGLSNMTFAQLFARTSVHLTLVASDTTDQSMLVLNHLTCPDCPVLWGVRMSMSIPFVWPEVLWKAEWGQYQRYDIAGHAIVDGGIISNFALRLLVSDDQWVRDAMGPVPQADGQTIGFWLDSDLAVPDAPAPAEALTGHHSVVIERVERIMGTATAGNDDVIMDAHVELVCRLPVKGYKTTDFNLSAQRIVALMNAGAQATEGYLQKHELAQLSLA